MPHADSQDLPIAHCKVNLCRAEFRLNTVNRFVKTKVFILNNMKPLHGELKNESLAKCKKKEKNASLEFDFFRVQLKIVFRIRCSSFQKKPGSLKRDSQF